MERAARTTRSLFARLFTCATAVTSIMLAAAPVWAKAAEGGGSPEPSLLLMLAAGSVPTYAVYRWTRRTATADS